MFLLVSVPGPAASFSDIPFSGLLLLFSFFLSSAVPIGGIKARLALIVYCWCRTRFDGKQHAPGLFLCPSVRHDDFLQLSL